jgi:hypothetical protein
MLSPLKLIAIGFALLVLGALLPFLMLLDLLESTLFLNIISVMCSVGGLTTGFIGLTSYLRRDR